MDFSERKRLIRLFRAALLACASEAVTVRIDDREIWIVKRWRIWEAEEKAFHDNTSLHPKFHKLIIEGEMIPFRIAGARYYALRLDPVKRGPDLDRIPTKRFRR